MTYVYHCRKCGQSFDVIKSVRDMEVSENCIYCGEFADRQFVPSKIHLMHTKVEHPEYNPGLGCIVRNKDHRAQIAKERGLIEVGNESSENWGKKLAKEKEEKQEKAYEEAFQEAKAMADSPSSIPTLEKLKEGERNA